MTETNQAVSASQQTRLRAMIIPREHGAWGLLLVPLFTGSVVGFAPQHRLWELLLFTLAAVSLFALRTPLESLLGAGTISARTCVERRTALVGSIGFAVPAALCLGLLMWKGQNSGLFAIAAAGACAFAMQAVLRRLGRSTRIISQVVGAIALTSTAPAAYYVATGQLDKRAFGLWIASWLFASNQIHFVQLSIHAGRATKFAEKVASAQSFLVAESLLVMLLVSASLLRVLPAFSIIAFAPALARGSSWFFRKSSPLDVKTLGWSEMKQGIAFGVLLAFTFLYRQ